MSRHEETRDLTLAWLCSFTPSRLILLHFLLRMLKKILFYIESFCLSSALSRGYMYLIENLFVCLFVFLQRPSIWCLHIVVSLMGISREDVEWLLTTSLLSRKKNIWLSDTQSLLRAFSSPWNPIHFSLMIKHAIWAEIF